MAKLIKGKNKDNTNKAKSQDTELKKLSRGELLTMLVETTKKCDELEIELSDTKKKLEDKNIAISESGSLAEAVLRLNGVMEAADRAKEQYLANIKARHEGGVVSEPIEITTQSVDAGAMEKETKARCEAMEKESKERCKAIEEQTKLRCKDMIEKAKQESQAYWDEVYDRIKKYSDVTDALKDETN